MLTDAKERRAVDRLPPGICATAIAALSLGCWVLIVAIGVGIWRLL